MVKIKLLRGKKSKIKSVEDYQNILICVKNG